MYRYIFFFGLVTLWQNLPVLSGTAPGYSLVISFVDKVKNVYEMFHLKLTVHVIFKIFSIRTLFKIPLQNRKKKKSLFLLLQ